MQAPRKMSPLEPPFGGHSLMLPLSAQAPGAEEPLASFPHFTCRSLLISSREILPQALMWSHLVVCIREYL